MSKYILTIDQGTTSSRVIIFDERGNIICKNQKELPQKYPSVGFVLHDPMQIYEDVIELMIASLTSVNIDYSDILGVGITNQRETTIVWDKVTGQPIYDGICWQSVQSMSICDDWKDKGYENLIHKKTGLIINPYFSASKIKYILDNVSGAKEKMDKDELMFGTVDSWLMYNLSGRTTFKTDYTNASRTMLFNIKDLEWDSELLDLFGIKSSMLPHVSNSSGFFCTIEDPRITRICRLSVCAVAGDQQSSLFGHACFNAGDIKITYGTGAFMLLNTRDKLLLSKDGLLTTIAYSIDNQVSYALEGSVFMAGGAINFIKDNLNLIENVYDTSFTSLDSNGVYFVPALTGLGAPYWDPQARGGILGLSRGTTREHIAWATLEAVGFSNKDIITSMINEFNDEINYVSVDGGVSLNRKLMQFQADVLACEVKTINTSEATALGVFYMCGLYSGLFNSLDEIKRLHKNISIYRPRMGVNEIEERYKKWHKAIKAIQQFE